MQSAYLRAATHLERCQQPYQTLVITTPTLDTLKESSRQWMSGKSCINMQGPLVSTSSAQEKAPNNISDKVSSSKWLPAVVKCLKYKIWLVCIQSYLPCREQITLQTHNVKEGVMKCIHVTSSAVNMNTLSIDTCALLSLVAS